ncbi:MAG: glycolate oxidase subunit GlcE [Alphaproteobacteria bacterium]|nr:glycolate oxidase subunit GlcE [Alphaproteobacteria bacterium]
MTSLLVPADEAQAVECVMQALAAHTTLAISGGGTKSAIGRPVQAAQDISMRAITGITLYEPAEMIISARAGTPLAEIEKTLSQKGQMLPFEPPDWRAFLGAQGEPSIGGAVAANLSGPRRVQSGALRDSLIGVRFINGKGEIIRTGGRVMKNVTGLDVVKLQAGAWGTLGLMSEVTFKVLPVPAASASLLFEGLDDHRAVAAMMAAMTSPFEVSAAAHLPARADAPAQTLLRLEHFPASVDYRSGALAKLLNTYGAPRIIAHQASQQLWQSIANVRLFDHLPQSAIWRVSIKPSDAARFTASLPQGLAQGLAQSHFYDWGGGLVWIACAAQGDAGAQTLRKALAQFGGHATLIRAPADIRAAADVFQPLPKPLAALQARVKASLDPSGLFNPGRMYAHEAGES